MVPSAPRVVGTHRFRSNVECNSTEEFYESNMFIPYLDDIIQSLYEQFSSHRQILLSLENILPEKSLESTFNDIPLLFKCINAISKMEKIHILEAGWYMWKSHRRKFHLIPKCPPEVLHNIHKEHSDTFPKHGFS